MNIELLVKMANEISAFFVAESNSEQAARDVANHITRYWEPRMRREMIAYFDRGGGGLDDVARSAIALLASGSGARAGS